MIYFKTFTLMELLLKFGLINTYLKLGLMWPKSLLAEIKKTILEIS